MLDGVVVALLFAWAGVADLFGCLDGGVWGASGGEEKFWVAVGAGCFVAPVCFLLGVWGECFEEQRVVVYWHWLHGVA